MRDVRFPLLLLLALLCPLCSAPPPQGFTSFQWFSTQHVQPNQNISCNVAMTAINQHLPRCKPTNTFLHDSPQNVINVCTLQSVCCRNCQNNCHRSAQPVGATVCRLTRGSTKPNCHYTASVILTDFFVACNPRQAGDPPNPLVPVHLD
ncbi:Ribonuclease K3 [Heterocephalus glaber]|uniref:Ribonuclease K6 n=1 Tax=Heterocephalus glaber TaxID=10181 RepID=G5B0T8_HETGA|nr:Ribonuclease K3 [Heterocephalus glaber]